MLYKALKYEEAIKFFQRALTLQHHPKCHLQHRAGTPETCHHREAKEYFDWFPTHSLAISVQPNAGLSRKSLLNLLKRFCKEEAAQQGFGKEEPPRRPTWRIGLGIVGIAAGATLASFGGMLSSIHGQPGLINGKEDFTQVYDTKGLRQDCSHQGALFPVGRNRPIGPAGEKRSPNATLPTWLRQS